MAAWRLTSDYWLERAERRPRTYVRQERVVRLYLKPVLGRRKLDHLSVKIVQDLLDRLFADGKSAATIHQIRKVLSAALTYAMRQEVLFRNVARLVEMPRYKPREAQHWSFEEAASFLEGARPDPLYAAFVLLTLYGLRRGEVVGIRWCDVDFARNVLRIRQQVQRINGTLQQVDLKTDSSRGDEPLLATARQVLTERRREQTAARTAAGKDWQGTGNDEELVFTTRTGRPTDPRNLERSFHRIRERLGLRRITPHGWRYGNATGLKDAGVNERDVQGILRHSSAHMTRYYERVNMDNKRDGLEKFEQALFAAGDGESCRQLLPSIKKKLHLSW